MAALDRWLLRKAGESFAGVQEATGEKRMPRNFLARAVLATALGCGVWAGLARAGERGYYPKTPPQATELPPGYPPVDSTPSYTPVWDRMTKGRPIGCWASFNGY